MDWKYISSSEFILSGRKEIKEMKLWELYLPNIWFEWETLIAFVTTGTLKKKNKYTIT